MYNIIEVVIILFCCCFGIYMAKCPEKVVKNLVAEAIKRKKIQGIWITNLAVIILVLKIITMIK